MLKEGEKCLIFQEKIKKRNWANQSHLKHRFAMKYSPVGFYYAEKGGGNNG